MERGAIGTRLERVREQVRQAARRAGRDESEVLLIAVTKTKSPQVIREAYESGQRDFGENYVQELVSKAEALRDLPDVRWHMIGHLQTNKAKQVLGAAHMVHTIDSVRLAAELGRRAAQLSRSVPVLIEVNVGGEEQKSGVSIGEAEQVVRAVREQGALKLRGLMTVPPFELEAEQTSVYFERLARLRDELGGRAELPDLSMGMSHDFEVAIQRGATMVRVGTMIFGDRR